MIYHTIVLPESLFGVISDMPAETIMNDFAGDLEKTEITYKGHCLVGYKMGANDFIVERIISTNPQIYLDEKLKPGKCLKV